MNADDTLKTFQAAQRAYERAQRAKSCSQAETNLRLGQKLEQRAYESMRGLIPAKLEVRHYSPIQHQLLDLRSLLSSYESNAHMHRLKKCGRTMLQHEHAAAADRVRSNASSMTDRALDRRDRKRPKKR